MRLISAGTMNVVRGQINIHEYELQIKWMQTLIYF